jgi:hypothetical protein
MNGRACRTHRKEEKYIPNFAGGLPESARLDKK